MQKIAKMLALVMGGLLVLIGAMSFLPMGLFGPGGLMVKYPNVPFVHLASGVILLLASTMGESWAAFGLYSVAFFNALLCGLGYMSLDLTHTSTLFGVLRLTQADLVFHAVLAAGLAICGKLNTARQQVIWD
jgi:hypothetical protein